MLRPPRLRTVLTIALAAVIVAAAYWIGREAWGAYRRQALDEALGRRDWKRAQTELARCLWLWPQRTELRLQAARLARRQGQADKARRELRHCRADPDLAVLVGLEEFLLAIQAGDFAGSSQLDEYARQNPQSPEALLIDEAQIVGSLAALDVPRAREYLARWMAERKAHADQVQGHVWQGTASILARDLTAALNHFDAALRLDPHHREARLSLAQILTESEPAEAAEHLELLRRAHPDDIQVLYQLALVQRNLGRLDDAAGTLDLLLKHAPEHIEALVLQGRLALDRQDLAAAGRWLSRAETLEHRHRAVMLAMVEYLRVSGRPEEASRYQQRMEAIEADLRRHVEAVLDERRKASRPPLPPQGPVVP